MASRLDDVAANDAGLTFAAIKTKFVGKSTAKGSKRELEPRSKIDAV